MPLLVVWVLAAAVELTEALGAIAATPLLAMVISVSPTTSEVEKTLTPKHKDEKNIVKPYKS